MRENVLKKDFFLDKHSDTERTKLRRRFWGSPINIIAVVA